MAGDALIATLMLGAMCLTMWWLARLAKRRMGVGAGTVSTSALRVVGKRPLDQRSVLYVVEIAGGRHILVGAGVDGTVTKVDDISSDEYQRMTGEPQPAAGRRLRVATTEPATGPSAVPDADLDDAVDDATTGADAAAASAEPAGDAQRFATVGESFSMLLGRARDARDARRDRRASGE